MIARTVRDRDAGDEETHTAQRVPIDDAERSALHVMSEHLREVLRPFCFCQ